MSEDPVPYMDNGTARRKPDYEADLKALKERLGIPDPGVFPVPPGAQFATKMRMVFNAVCQVCHREWWPQVGKGVPKRCRHCHSRRWKEGAK